jgi:acetyl-CoA C-acetyltransferase
MLGGYMRTVLLAGARTPVGKLSGSLASLTAADLATHAIAGALTRAEVAPEEIELVAMGHVLQAGQGQLPGRQAAVRAGVSMATPTVMINKVCLSGLAAVHVADLMVRSGEAAFAIAGGMESMTNAPFLVPGARTGLGFGNKELVDAVVIDGLFCAVEQLPMGESTERHLSGSLSRQEQDEFAALSHERASHATLSGRLAQEIEPIVISQRRGEPVVVSTDEGIRFDTSVDALGRLKPAFVGNGSITAGNASQISDGAVALIVTSVDQAERLGVTPLAEIVGYGQVAGPDASLLLQPAHAIRRALERADLPLADIDLFEINEAFAAVAVASMRELGIDHRSTNVNGGAIAIGHPIGMSGARLALSLAYELSNLGSGLGAVALCGGGGQGDAMLLRAVK